MSESKNFDPKSLDDLLAKVQAATGPDRRIDGDVAEALRQVPMVFVVRNSRQPELWSDGGPGLRARTWLAPKYTESLDAMLALSERTLGRALMWSVCIMEEGPYAQVLKPMPDGGYVGGHHGSYGNSAPLALLAALLSSLKAST